MLQQQHPSAETYPDAAMPPTSAADGSAADSVHTHSSSDSQEDTVEMETTQTMSHRNTSIMLDEDERMELRRIATAMSQRRRVSVAHAIPESESSVGLVDLALDPESKLFDMEKWLRGVVNDLQKEGIALKRAGVAYQNLVVSGTGDAMQVQQTVGSFLQAPLRLGEHFSFGKKEPKMILHKSDGILRSGELLIVLGRPGSGCSTLLKTMTGQLEGLDLGEGSRIHYNGIPQKEMIKEFKGETTYNQEVDKHFPPPSHRRSDPRIRRSSPNTVEPNPRRVGNDFIRGVSGGERKRVSIAEMMLAGSPLAAWDNSTRGLDSATAFKFVNSLRLASNLSGSTHAVAIYQASQAIYDLFDKAVVLYEGRQIFFGPAEAARPYFAKMGWHCPQRQTTGDFLTSVTNPQERVAREGMENRVPRTAEEFEQYWLKSPEHEALQKEVQQYEQEFPVDANGLHVNEMRHGKNRSQAKHVRPESPYMISMAMQIKLTTKRAYQRIWNDLSATGTSAVINAVLAIIGSVFYGTPNTTGGFYSKGSVLFNAILLNALTAISEINSLYSQRPIVEKHASYAFYHPAAEAIAGIVADIPIKFITATVFNIIIYFLSDLRREADAFFLFFLVSYISTFVMSAIFRTLAAVTKTVSGAMSLAGVMVLALVMYAGFMIRVPQMHDWFSWIRWINPIYYAFEILIANEFHGQRYDCAEFVPPYSPLQGDSWICSTVGAVAGQRWVSGDDFIETNYEYYHSHTWRNFGILVAFLVFFMAVYFVATEMNSATGSVAEVLVFRRGAVPGHLKNGVKGDTLPDVSRENNDNPSNALNSTQSDIFTWRDVKYDVDIKGTQRTLLNNVSGWVKPGTLTALMGVSGAGKTTLLDVLAQRTTTGVITGDMFVNGKPLNASFQRKTGYVQQQDLHLETATVRESLRFSAMLRQPATVSKQDKYNYVEDVIDMLSMRDFADAVVGIPGEGLNIEQRKLLTIGVELAARPKLLIFLDEPTSGLDSQSSWAICAFLRKLADAGQAVLCTVHQPSAILFQKFDRLLFLAAGGKTVYFGDIGDNSRTLLDYFELNGARHCGGEENPAEYMLDVVNQGTSANGQDWHSLWLASPERQGVMEHIEQIHAEKAGVSDHEGEGEQSEFAVSFGMQVVAVTTRVFQQYWRTPSYVFSKFSLGIAAGLFIGFSFYDTKGTLAGMQNVLFAVFMVITMFSTLVQQIQPYFISQRALYEVRERPSKAYSWKAFLIASVCVEIPYQLVTGIIMYACLFYPVVGVQDSSRQGLVLIFMMQIFLYASSFAQMTIAALPDAQTASGLVTLLTLMSLTFCGVMQAPSALPGFWMFMYRVSPFTYWIGGIVSTLLHGRAVECSVDETSVFSPPQNQTCGEYMSDFLSDAPGMLQNPDATEQCRYCSLTVADQYLSGSGIFYSERFRNFGIMWAFILFNVFIAVATYYMFRVKTWNFKSFGKKPKA
ncbi:ABC-2 type transporter [Dactylonectria macrodidyma]|uniref:ABC-2 type transporter n=1 Tax=Dactylonectria macrodidyma TaxID=307937 RepID=A0A9P9ICM2_9HYPO|nr:ABC-2 type transporter [Dactylonectria macrodidyma]